MITCAECGQVLVVPSAEYCEKNNVVGLTCDRGHRTMLKKPMTPDDEIAETNRRLPSHPYYIKGMKLLPYPPGSSGRGMSGIRYSHVGASGVYADIAHEIWKGFYLVP